MSRNFQSTAVQAIRDSLGDCKEINQHSAILKSIHAYWIKKRGALQKPLCRKFWPQTQPSDLNPHHVFRPRDKEPYRLRKNIRKNDIECFR